jgi:glycosyltransferase involved in cell wall biosynthesis
MKKLLVITLLEYLDRPNNRIQHTVAALKDDFDEVWLLCRSRPTAGGLGAKLRNMFPAPARILRDGKIQVVEYDPPLNYIEGYTQTGNGEDRTLWLKSILNFLGIFREFFFILTIGYVSLRHAKGPFHICVVETFWEGLVAIFLRRLGRVKYCIFDDNDFNPGYMQNSFRRWWETTMEKFCIRASDLVIAVGHLLAEYWEKEIGRDVLVIPNGVDLKYFKPGDVTREEDTIRLVYVGNLSARWVELDLVLRSMEIILEKGSDIRLVVAGTGRKDYLDRIDVRIKEYDLVKHVEFLGVVEHEKLPLVLGSCHIGLAVAPENILRRYAFPLKIVEYMAMGLPVIGNRGTESGRVIEYYEAGVSLNPVIGEMCEALSRLVGDRDFYERCRANAIAGARDFDLEKIAEQRRNEIVRRFP